MFRRDVVAGPDGAVRDRYAYPLEAFRELVGNALVHRDLDTWSEHRAVEVRLTADRLVVTNPGGLYGITVDRLGQPGTSTPPQRPARPAVPVRTDRRRRPRRRDPGQWNPSCAGRSCGRRPGAPTFYDSGLQFTVLLRAAVDPVGLAAPAASPPDIVRGTTRLAVYRTLAASEAALSIAQIAEASGLPVEGVRKIVRALVRAEVVSQHGGRGRSTTYSLAPQP